MATITTDTYLDGGVARTAGEAWTVNSGAKFTIRTDTRFHLNSPVSMTGSIGSITCNEGEVYAPALSSPFQQIKTPAKHLAPARNTNN